MLGGLLLFLFLFRRRLRRLCGCSVRSRRRWFPGGRLAVRWRFGLRLREVLGEASLVESFVFCDWLSLLVECRSLTSSW